MSQGPPRAYSSYSTIPRQQQGLNSQPSFQSALGPTSMNGSSNRGGSTTTTGGSTQETLYCDSCQTFRHVSFFNERDFKYNVCNICHSREIQKRKHQLERYELYEEQQRTLKQARYQSIQAPPTSQSSNSNNAPITLGSTTTTTTTTPSQTSPLIKPAPTPTTSSVMLASSHQNNMLTTPNSSSNNSMRNQSQLQSHMQSLQTITLPPPLTPTPQQQQDPVAIMLPTTATVIDSPTPSAKSTTSDKDMIDLDQFVKELEKETEFDRKQYCLDIEVLMTSMGENAGFTQLGRGICEKVLEGTTFNFSLKDRRRSTKSPDTLSTLRYYCSQRSDTAKPRKAENPKAQNRYDCAGALTIIIDLVKKTAHVTVIHKHQHPPFVSQHHHQQQQKKAQQHVQQQQQQQQVPQYVERQYEMLRQRVVEIGILLGDQQRFGNADFLQTATEALSSADEMLTACKSYESTNAPLNKYTMHYNKTTGQK